MKGFPTFKGSWPSPWIRSYCILSGITCQPLPTCVISLKLEKLSVDGRMDGRIFETHFIRSTQKSQPKNPGSNGLASTTHLSCVWPQSGVHMHAFLLLHNKWYQVTAHCCTVDSLRDSGCLQLAEWCPTFPALSTTVATFLNLTQRNSAVDCHQTL